MPEFKTFKVSAQVTFISAVKVRAVNRSHALQLVKEYTPETWRQNDQGGQIKVKIGREPEVVEDEET
jgi:hypothetical protein